MSSKRVANNSAAEVVVTDKNRLEGRLEEGDLLPTPVRFEQPQVELLGAELLQGIIANYVNYYAAGDTHTARAKRYDLEDFLQFLTREHRGGAVLVSDWTLQATKDFVDYRLSLGEAPSTVARRLATIKHFGRTLAERIPGYINPAREVKSPVHPLPRPRGLNEEEVGALRQAAQQIREEAEDSFTSFRNFFLVELFLSTGLRADEVRCLVVGQLAEDGQWLKNVKTKGKRFRNVYLDSEVRVLLEEYLTRRESELVERFPGIRVIDHRKLPLFVSFYRATLERPSTLGLSPKTIWRIVSYLGKRAQPLLPGRIGNLHPHRLRHAFAHGLLDSSKDIRLVAQALGHSDVRTTMRYTERSEEEIAKAIERKRSNS